MVENTFAVLSIALLIGVLCVVFSASCQSRRLKVLFFVTGNLLVTLSIFSSMIAIIYAAFSM